MNELTQEIHTYLTTAPGSNFLEQTVTIHKSWEGADNLLWLVERGGQEAVVKYYLDAGQARGRRQLDGQERFHAFGIAPRPLWFDRYPTGLSRQVLVYEWRPGTPLETPTDAQLRRFAQAVAQVHRGDPTEVRRFSPNPVNLDYLWHVLHGGMPSLQQWLPKGATLATLLQQLDVTAQVLVEAALPLWQGVAPTPVHGDLKLENTIDSFGTIVLLDWEMFGLGDAAYDVATFLQLSQVALDESARGRWLESYLASFEQPGLAERIGVYERLLPLHNLCYLLHGLRQSQPEEHVALRENQPFLQATVVAAIEQAVVGLNVSVTVPEQGISDLFDFAVSTV